MSSENNYRRLLERIDSYRSELIELQRELVATPALGPENGGEGEYKKSEFLEGYLVKLGLKVEVYNAPDERVPDKIRPNLVVRYPGEDRSRAVWVLAHTDVVPPGEYELWDSNPFELVEKEGKLYGRGTEDNHQGLVASVLALRSFIEEKITPGYNIGLALVADEECGSEYGLDYLLKSHPDIFKKDDLILVPDFGKPDGKSIEVAEKSILWLKFKTIGKQCHASTPYKGKNAFKAASKLIVKLDQLHQRFDATNDLFDPPKSTFEPTKKEGNVPNINTLPGEDVFYFDCRILPEYDVAEVEKAIHGYVEEIGKEFGVSVEITDEQRSVAAPPTPTDSPVVKALTKAVKKVYEVDPQVIGIGGGTVAAFFRRAGLPAAVYSKLDEVAHQPNEYCHIDNVLGDAKVFAHVMFFGEGS
jgi:succinyl-diaminopimelate desuccinylase